MSDEPTHLDDHRGMLAQKATEKRRLAADVMAAHRALQEKRATFEAQLTAEPAADWHEVADKVRYLLTLFAESSVGNPQRLAPIERAMADLNHLDGSAR